MQALVNLIDHGMTVQQAVGTPVGIASGLARAGVRFSL